MEGVEDIPARYIGIKERRPVRHLVRFHDGTHNAFCSLDYLGR